MVEFETVLNLQLQLFLLMVVGVYAKKRNFIDDVTVKKLSDLLINVILPCNIISSFCVNLSVDLLKKSVIVLLISFGVQFLGVGLSIVLYPNVEHRKKMVLQYATICSNSGFMGLPVAQGVFGEMGLLYASIALIPVRIIMWSAGLSHFTKTDKKTVIKTLVFHPCIIAVYIGFIILFSGVQLPVFLSKTINSVGGCTTAISMIIIGAILSGISIKSVISKITLYYAAVRLILIPVIILLVLKLLKIDNTIMGVSVLMAAMPAASTTAILAAKYDGDSEFASKCIFISTILSVVTIPVISLFM